MTAEASETPPGRPITRLLGLIPIVIFFSYLFSFATEAGHASIFGYPSAFIPVSFSIIKNQYPSNFFFLLYAFGFLQLSLQYIQNNHKNVFRLLWGGMVLYAIYVALYNFFPRWTILAFFAAIGFSAILRDVHRRQGGNASSYVPNVYDRRASVPDNSIAHFFLRKLGFDPLLLFLVLLIMFPMMFYCSGAISAAKQREFYVISVDNQDFIVLRSFSDQLIVSPIGGSPENYRKEYMLIPTIEAGLLRAVTLKSRATPIE